MESLTGYKLQIRLGIQEKYDWDACKKIYQVIHIRAVALSPKPLLSYAAYDWSNGIPYKRFVMKKVLKRLLALR